MSDEPMGPLGGAEPVAGVLFDYGLTLVRFERPVAAIEEAQESIADAIEAAGLRRPSATELRSAVHERVAAAVAGHEESGALEELDVATLERQAFADIGLRLDDDLFDRCRVLVQEAWWGGVHVYDDVAVTLRELRAGGLRLGVCSNAPYRPASMHAQLTHLGLDQLVDAAVFSGEVGWRKPSLRLFEAALRALGVGATQTVFVGDRMREDIAGAAAAGMRTVLILRDGVSTPPSTSAQRPDAVISTLTALTALLLDDSRP